MATKSVPPRHNKNKTQQRTPPEVCHACERDYTLEEGGVFAIQIMIGGEPFGAPLGFPICRQCHDKASRGTLACKIIEGAIRANNAEMFAMIEGGARGVLKGLSDYQNGGDA